MLRGVTALLEAIDERAEQHARQAVERNVEINVSSCSTEGHDPAQQGMLRCNVPDGSVAIDPAGSGVVHLPTFPEPPFPLHGFAAPPHHDDAVAPSLNTWSHIEGNGIATTASALAAVGRDSSSPLTGQKEKQIEALTQMVQQYQAAAEVAKQELLQQSLRVCKLEEALQDTKTELEEHKVKSRLLLEERQRQCEELHARLERRKESVPFYHSDDIPGQAESHFEGVEGVKTEEGDVGDLRNSVTSLQRQREWLEAQVAAGRRETTEFRQRHSAVLQDLEFLKADLKGVQEALDSEVAAHNHSKALLQSRQRELNELRAAVERNGGTFTASGALVALRPDGRKEGDVLLSRQLLEKHKAMETALRDAAEWRRRCERMTNRLEEERTARVSIEAPYPMGEVGEPHSVTFFGEEYNGVVGQFIGKCGHVLDSTALHTARLLRRSSPLRIFTMVYIVCLHVLIVVVPLMLSS